MVSDLLCSKGLLGGAKVPPMRSPMVGAWPGSVTEGFAELTGVATTAPDGAGPTNAGVSLGAFAEG